MLPQTGFIPGSSNQIQPKDGSPLSFGEHTSCLRFQPPHKRTSIEMEDELTTKEAPPTKQQLSENKLFRQFGSLKLDYDNICQDEDFDADEDEGVAEDDGVESTKAKDSRREFDRYVYLLFKDRELSSVPFAKNCATSKIFDRLLRDEQEKISKAVILWSPPLKDSFQTVGSDSDDEDFNYKDHKDFLKEPNNQTNNSVIITEITDFDKGISDSDMMPAEEPEDAMIVE